MTRKPPKHRLVDAQLKAAFDAKAAEPVPEHLLDLVEELEDPTVASKAS